MRYLSPAVILLALFACKRSGAPSSASDGGPPQPSAPAGVAAGDVCYKLEAAGVASKC